MRPMRREPSISVCAFLLLAWASRALGGDPVLGSPDFSNGAEIPGRFTCHGENVSPTLEISGVPASAKSLLLIVEDPDAPGGIFTHWLLWNVPPTTRKITAGALPGGAVQGTNDFGRIGYSGPCPPSGTHRYFFRLFVLNGVLKVPAGAARKEVHEAMSGHISGEASLMGRCSSQ